MSSGAVLALTMWLAEDVLVESVIQLVVLAYIS